MSEAVDDVATAVRQPVSGATLVTAACVLAAAVATFVVVARRVATGAAEEGDRAMRRRIQAHRSPVIDTVVVRPVTVISLPALVLSATAALVWYLHHRGRRPAAAAIGATPVVAAIAGQSFTTFLRQRNPPDRDASDDEVLEPSFPSGHTTGVTSGALAIAFVLGNEGLASPEWLALLIAWPFAVGVTRVYRDRHWVSDILGGWAAGAGVAAGSALLYGMLSRERD